MYGEYDPGNTIGYGYSKPQYSNWSRPSSEALGAGNTKNELAMSGSTPLAASGGGGMAPAVAAALMTSGIQYLGQKDALRKQEEQATKDRTIQAIDNQEKTRRLALGDLMQAISTGLIRRG